MKELVIIGSGGFSKQVIEIVEEMNAVGERYNLIGIIDDNKEAIGSTVLDYEIIGDTDYLKEYSNVNNICAVIAIANDKVRNKISNKLTEVEWINLIHPKAIVSKYIKMGVGNIICGGVVINPGFTMGNHSHINIGSTFGHDISVADFVTVMPGVRVSGNVFLKSNTMIGTGSTIIQGLTIEENVRLGAGTVVIDKTEPKSLYVGVPAKRIKK